MSFRAYALGIFLLIFVPGLPIGTQAAPLPIVQRFPIPNSARKFECAEISYSSGNVFRSITKSKSPSLYLSKSINQLKKAVKIAKGLKRKALKKRLQQLYKKQEQADAECRAVGQHFSSSSSSSSSSQQSSSSSSSITRIDELAEHFANQELIEQASDVIWDQVSSISPSRPEIASPVPESSTLLRIGFDTPQQAGYDTSFNSMPMLCSSCPSLQAGKIGEAAVFKGGEAFVTRAQLSEFKFSNSDFTIMLWIKTNKSSTPLVGAYCGYGHFGLQFNLNDGKVVFGVDPASGSSATLTSSRSNLNDNSWHHIAIQREASSGLMNIFIDGVLDASTTGSVMGGDITCGRLSLGSNNVGYPLSGTYVGLMDEFSVESRLLSSYEISSYANPTALRGEVLSKEIHLTQPLYALSGTMLADNPQNIRLEVSFDNEHYCKIDGELNDPNCPFPARKLRYRVSFLDHATLDAITLSLGYNQKCIDYDNDGSGIDPTTSSLCVTPLLDCEDSNPARGPLAQAPSCQCGTFPPAQEICNDNLDNDCDGAVDEEDIDCYTLGNIYYVSNTWGHDGNSGLSPADPVKSTALAQSLLSLNFKAGDKILFQRNNSWDSPGLHLSVSGTAEKAVTIGAYGFGDKPILNATAEGTFLETTGAYSLIENLHLYRSSKSLSVIGIQVSADNATLRNLHVQGLAGGLLVGGSNFIIEDSFIENNENEGLSGHSQGMFVYDGSDYGVIRNCRWYHNGKRVMFDHNVYLGGGNYWLFEGNSFSGSGGTSIVFHGIQRGHVIRNNVFHDNDTFAIDISEYEGTHSMRLEDFVVERNLFFNNPGGFWLRGPINLTVRNNIFYNNLTGPMFSGGDGPFNVLSNLVIDHNTFVNNADSLVGLSTSGLITFKNNIVYQDEASKGSAIFDLLTFSSSRVFTSNLYYLPRHTNGHYAKVNGSLYSLTEMKELGFEHNSIQGNPVFIDLPWADYRLRSSSPAVDNATSSTEELTDYLGKSRPLGSGPDIGAYESW